MKCTECGDAGMAKNFETIEGDECGLPNVTLVEVTVYRCEKCGERLVEIPKPQELLREIASAFKATTKKTRLTAKVSHDHWAVEAA